MARLAGLTLVATLTGGALLTGCGSSSPEKVCDATALADSVLPSVVSIDVRGAQGSTGNGSGEVIRDDGYILTNDHVISGATTGIEVLFTNGESEPATVTGRSSPLDLAVLKVTLPKGVPVIETGDAETLRVGQPVVALGAPLGLQGTVTSGIVSSLGRNVTVGGALIPGAVQTDASINPGNSGGPLVDCAGKLIGINTAIATVPGQSGGGSVGIGFAIPVDVATVVARQLIDTGRFAPPSTGLSTIPIPAAAADHLGVPGGLFVQAVSSGSPAAEAGLAPGDVITSVDGKQTTSPDSLVLATLTKKSGDRVTVEYLRDGKTRTTTMTL